MNTIQLYDPDFNYLFAFSKFTQLQTTLKYYGKSNLAIAVSEKSDAAHFLQPDNYITFEHNGKNYPFIIKRKSINSDTVTVQCFSVHDLFERRITMPPIGQYAIASTGTPDKVIKDFIRSCTSDERGLPILLAADKSGHSITDTSRLKNLGDEITRICESHAIGESFELDAKNKCFVFDTYSGADKTPNNTEDNPPCVFAAKYHNLTDYQYSYDTTGIITTPIVAGAGEGAEREIYIVGNDKEGLARYETLVDARDVDQGDVDLLAERGNAKIINATETVSTTENQSGNLVFGVDYDLGDIVAVKFDIPQYIKDGDFYDMVEQPITVKQRVSEVTITISDISHDIDIKYGNIALSKSNALIRDVEQLKSSY